MEMQFKEGTRVFAADDQEVGAIDRVVIDPATKEVTHVVIRKGFLFPVDKVIPIELIAMTSEERVTLRKSGDELLDFPIFEETHYLSLHDGDTEGRSVPESHRYAPSVYAYPPVGVLGWGDPGYPIYPYVVETRQNIPEGTVALKEGARVISADGHHVGDVERVFTNSQDDRITHLVISQGLLLKAHKLIPISWVSSVGEDEVHLAVMSNLLENLPEYQPQP